MRRQFDQQLALLNRELIEMGALCEEVIALASKALTEGDPDMAARVAPLDTEIDQKERTIESLCLKLLLQQQPVARAIWQRMSSCSAVRPFRKVTISAMSWAWSPMRSMSVIIFRAAEIWRRSRATGCCRSRSFCHTCGCLKRYGDLGKRKRCLLRSQGRSDPLDRGRLRKVCRT